MKEKSLVGDFFDSGNEKTLPCTQRMGIPTEQSEAMFGFSSATSLESSMTLVSGAMDLTEMVLNRENGTREKRFEDGRVEFWYSNGNR